MYKRQQQDLAYTLTALDRHAVYARQRVDEFKNDNIASMQSARQAKDATDLVAEPERQYAQFIRRLTPLECERLQGFPDAVSYTHLDVYKRQGNGRCPRQCRTV